VRSRAEFPQPKNFPAFQSKPARTITQADASSMFFAMGIANWLTLTASLITLLSVVVSYSLGKQQIKNAHELALKQINAAAKETSRRLKAEILL
jgi:hypothetical protein